MLFRSYTEAYNAGFAWVLILLGLMLLAVGNILPGMSLLVPIGKWLAILNAIGILIVSIVSAKKLSGLASGLFNLYNVSGYVGDLVSFTRLMALGLSGASIGSAFNLIVNLFPPLGRFTVGLLLFIVLHAINMFLSLIHIYLAQAKAYSTRLSDLAGQLEAASAQLVDLDKGQATAFDFS